MRYIATALALLLATTAGADDGTSFKALAASAALASKPNFSGPYGSGDFRHGDLRLPAGRGRFPVAILIHGGCWNANTGDPSDVAALAAALAKRGIATWSIEYRRVGNPGGGWPGTFEDVGDGVDYLRVLAGKFPLNLGNVIVVGHSSGAHLALWAASRRQLHDPVGGTDPIKLAGVVAIDGPASLAPFIGVDSEVCGHPAIIPLMGGTPAEKPDAYRLAQPADHLPLGVRQYVVKGELGALMEPYVTAARAAGDKVELLAPTGADHFDILDPGTANGAAVVDFIVKAVDGRETASR
ncbi:alpha/beta hydrolase [Polymorphobacter sp. PAMC 29334]|uniref:alpha/beta hydrolase n=1 Tax=Polymorphobacter sp. PAMC 29334 TaxID=2862331 RepID=UPI001C680EC1|nr:alpha/beta hydrolase [Polymorphobacter sp. PAMC 29334]QYE36088.1 alpha/beta hydrolase [Polymorphobacter sp. PAMC 29334]